VKKVCENCGGTGATGYDVSPDEDGAIICDVCGGEGMVDDAVEEET